jgi:Molecular chaperone GrpE (heat shock protein)
MSSVGNEEKTENPDVLNQEEVTNLQDEQSNEAENASKPDNMSTKQENDESSENYKEKYDALNDSYLRLIAEFDNYRKRTLKEKADLIKSGGESALAALLPVIDDFERAMQTINSAEDVKAVAEGVELIFSKFTNYLTQQGVKAIDTTGQPFDTETSDAIATIPAPSEDLKGKVIDCIQTGYTLNDKIIRHAKVVVGE